MAPPVYLLFKQYSVEVKKWLQAIFHIPRLDSTDARVKVVYATPERAIAKYIVPIRNKQTDIPVVGFYLAGIAYSSEKNIAVENLETIYDKDNNIASRVKPLQVYTLTYAVNIWTKLQMDMDIVLYQLLTQFTPFRYLAVESGVNYKDYENRERHYPMEGGPEQGRTWDSINEKWVKKPGQWFPLLMESVNDASNLEPGEAGDRLVRYDVSITCDRAYLPIGGFEYKTIQELEINTVTDLLTVEGINIYALSEPDYEYLMSADDDWLPSVTEYTDLPLTGNSVGDVRRVTSETEHYDDGEPYVYDKDTDISFYKAEVNAIIDLPASNSPGDIAFAIDERYEDVTGAPSGVYFEWRKGTVVYKEGTSEEYEVVYETYDWVRLDPEPTGAMVPDVTVAKASDLPSTTNNTDGDIRYVNNENDYYRWNAFESKWQRYNRWVKLTHYLRDTVI